MEQREHEDVIAADEPVDRAARVEDAKAIVRRHVHIAIGVGVLPFPAIDVVALIGLQLKLLRDLSQHYEQEFSEGIARKVITSLLTSVGAVGIGGLLGASLVKTIPYVGTALGVASTPLLAGTFTHAFGNIFMMHLESGGTLLDFDPEAMREHFEAELADAQATVEELAKQEREPARRRWFRRRQDA